MCSFAWAQNNVAIAASNAEPLWTGAPSWQAARGVTLAHGSLCVPGGHRLVTRTCVHPSARRSCSMGLAVGGKREPQGNQPTRKPPLAVCSFISRRTVEQTSAKIACWPCATWSDLGRQDIGAVSDLALGVDGRNLYAATDQGVVAPTAAGWSRVRYGESRLSSPGLNPTCAINASGSPEKIRRTIRRWLDPRLCHSRFRELEPTPKYVGRAVESRG